MATEIRVPTLGESVSEATIGKWFKKVGDAIDADEPLVELETDKVTHRSAGARRRQARRDHRQGRRDGRRRRAARPDFGRGAGATPASRRRLRHRRQDRKRLPRRPERCRCRFGQGGGREDRHGGRRGRPVEERRMPPAPAAAKLLRRAQCRGRPGGRVRQARPGAEGRRAARRSPGARPRSRRAAEGCRRRHGRRSAEGAAVRRRRPTMRRARSGCA